MDSIDKFNNAFRTANAIKKGTVVLKTGKIGIATMKVIVLDCKDEDITFIKANSKFPEYMINRLKEEQLIRDEVDVKVIFYMGDLPSFESYGELVYRYPQRKVDFRNNAEQEYRDYTVSKERQQASTIKLCVSNRSSWDSAIKKLGSKTGVIFRVITVN